MPGKAVRKGKKLIFRKHQLFPSCYFIMFFFKYLIWTKLNNSNQSENCFNVKFISCNSTVHINRPKICNK